MRQDYTDITVVLDRTGSMSDIADDMRGGFNTFIAEQKKLPGELRVSLFQFDSVSMEWVYENRPVAEVPPLELIPRSNTPLWDALGRSVTDTGNRLAKLAEADRPGHVLVLVITDGQENSSNEWEPDKVRELIKTQTDQYKWSFQFLGAGLSDFVVRQIAMASGIPTLSSTPVRKSKKAVANLYQNLNVNVASYRADSAGSLMPDFTPEQKDALQEEDDGA